jgi:hypothetical protein
MDKNIYLVQRYKDNNFYKKQVAFSINKKQKNNLTLHCKKPLTSNENIVFELSAKY